MLGKKIAASILEKDVLSVSILSNCKRNLSTTRTARAKQRSD